MLARNKLTLIACFLLLGLCVLYPRNSSDAEQTEPAQEQAAETRPDQRQDIKTILLWNTLYKASDWSFGLGQAPFLSECSDGFSNCRTTDKRSELAGADAVTFHIADIQSTLGPHQKVVDVLPERGKPAQVFVFWNHEPPLFGRRDSLIGLRGVFNVTVTYRPDSTIYLPLHKMTPIIPADPELDSSSIMSRKTKLVCWVVSACAKAHSHRFEYVKELANYIDVDIYGKCGNYTCPASGSDCFRILSVSYKFYLAFENSYCRHYITEKPFRTLKYNWVPVVLGASNYSEYLPPKSFIDVRDFNSPKELAQYLRYLDQHDSKYMEYLQSRRHFRVTRQKTKEAFCKLCDMLNQNNPDQYERDLDPHRWWEESGCIDAEHVPEEIHLE